MKKQAEAKQIDVDAMHAELGTWSAVIRNLHAMGMSRGDIAKTTGKRYQHVRNVLTHPVKKD